MMSRIRYATEIFYPYIANSMKKAIETGVRTMTRNIYNTAKNSPTKYMNQITNSIPLGIKALNQRIKL